MEEMYRITNKVMKQNKHTPKQGPSYECSSYEFRMLQVTSNMLQYLNPSSLERLDNIPAQQFCPMQKWHLSPCSLQC